MSTPSKEQLDRYMDLVVEGHTPEDAMEVVFPPAKEKKPTIMVTEFPDGVVIGWDHCARCNKSVRTCACKEGPQELRVFEQWRTGNKTMPDYAAAAKQAAAAGVPKTEALGKGNKGVVVAIEQGLVACVIHGDAVPEAEADKNDDDTWTCHTCQESGAQRRGADV